MKGHFARILGVLAFLVLASPAQAQSMLNGWYFEIAVGEARFKDANRADLDLLTEDFFNFYNLDVTGLSSTLQRKDRSYALISGYRFNRNLMMEVGYHRMGAFQYASTGTVSDSGGPLPASFSFRFRAKGVHVGVVGAWPVGEYLELRARGGLSTSDTRVRYSATVQASTLADEIKASSQDFYAGVGAGVKLFDYYRLGIDWIRHRKVGKQSLTYSSDIDNVLLSFSYQY